MPFRNTRNFGKDFVIHFDFFTSLHTQVVEMRAGVRLKNCVFVYNTHRNTLRKIYSKQELTALGHNDS